MMGPFAYSEMQYITSVMAAHAVNLLQQNRESVQKMHYNKAGMTPETAIVANMYLFLKT
jgi:hypothetical protein